MADSILDGKKSGVYSITCLSNGKVYIGSAKSLQRRKATHWRDLARGTHTNAKLQSAWNKHGAEQFVFNVVAYCEVDELLSKEQSLIDQLNATVDGFNIAKSVTAPMTGRNHSEQAKARIAEFRTGSTYSAVTIQALSAAAQRNKAMTAVRSERIWAARSEQQKAEIISKVARKNTGKVRSAAAVEKFRNVALNLWATEEHREKMENAHANRRDPVWTQESKDAHRKKVHAYQNSEAARESRMRVHLGRKNSEATKQKMAASALAREARKRAAAQT